MNKIKLSRKIRKQYGSMVLIGLMMASAVLSGVFIGSAFGENYLPNLTKSEWEQYRLTELCYVMEDKMTIEMLEEFCDLNYGGLEQMYGDKIK